MPRRQLPCLVGCVAAFAAQKSDMNVSLTAVGMLWAAVDFVEKHKRSHAAASVAAGGGPQQDEADAGGAWDAMLDELGRLAVDTRPEVRNCAVNTLVSAVGANGLRLSALQWQSALEGVVLPLVQQVAQRTRAASRPGGAAAAVHEVRSNLRATYIRIAQGAPR